MKSIFQTPTPDINASLKFYEAAGFKIIESDGKHYAIGKGCSIFINTDRFARAGIIFYSDNWKEIVSKLNEITFVKETETGYLLSDPSNVWIYLESETPYEQIFNLQEESSIFGKFAGLSLESIDIKRSVALWSILGFEQESGNLDQGWATYKNPDGQHISFMTSGSCPHLFFNPSFTYFNSGKNPEVIEKVKAAQIEITEGITIFNDAGEVDNIIVRDPGGFGFFVFND